MSNPSAPTVFIVHNDEDTGRALELVIHAAGLPCRGFRSSDALVDAVTAQCPGCLLLDLPRGSAALAELRRRGYSLPILVHIASADVASAVAAMQAGAIDVVESPFSSEVLLHKIREALEQDAKHRQRRDEIAAIRERLASLTAGEREVLELLCAGRNNRQISAALKLSRRAVESRRSKLMEKLQAASLPDLIRLTVLAEAECG